MADWVSVAIAFLALCIAAGVAIDNYQHRRRRAQQADVTVYFHWLSDLAPIELSSGEVIDTGYHLVLWNRGPAPAQNVDLEIFDPKGVPLRLLACDDDEFPIPLLESGVKYPIPWLVDAPAAAHRARRFHAKLTWTDDRGPRRRVIPLRRGQVTV